MADDDDQRRGSTASPRQRVMALVPLALISLGWTLSVSGVSASPAATANAARASSMDALSSAPVVPEAAIEASASLSGAGASDREISQTRAAALVKTSSTNAIPDPALAAYQRAESVINSADETCNLTWQLIAAIGRVESNHGRYGGNALDDDGIAQPGIYGIALNGSNNTSTIRDTDAGQFDNDLVYDRAVGPMQFIPSTWSVVGVDADGDGQRNPQDIDDAALATAVYLCSGTQSTAGDLSTTAGQRAAVYRYNHSQAYVDLVLSIMNAYLDGDFTSIPNNTTAAGLLVPVQGASTRPVDDGEPSTPAAEPAGRPEDADDQAAAPGAHGPTAAPGSDGPGEPTPPAEGSHSIQRPQLPTTNLEPVDHVLTDAQALLQCTADGLLDNPLRGNDRFDQCVDDLTRRRP